MSSISFGQNTAASVSDVTTQGRVGDTEIHWAAYRGHAGVVERLLKGGAKVDQRVDRGSTPLHLAAYKGHHQVASLLIQYGANVNARNEEGITPLDWARSNNHPEVEKVLLAHNAVVGKPLPVKSQNNRRGAAAGSSPGRYLLSQSGQYRVKPLQKDQPRANIEEDVVERPIRQEELDKLESVSQINEIMVKHRDKEALQPTITVNSADPEIVQIAELEQKLTEEKTAEKKSPERVLPEQAYRIQLAAVGSRDRARVLRAEYTRRYSTTLGESSLVVEPVTVGALTLYRIRSSALSASEAVSVCSELHSRSQDCIVVASAGR